MKDFQNLYRFFHGVFIETFAKTHLLFKINSNILRQFFQYQVFPPKS